EATHVVDVEKRRIDLLLYDDSSGNLCPWVAVLLLPLGVGTDIALQVLLVCRFLAHDLRILQSPFKARHSLKRVLNAEDVVLRLSLVFFRLAGVLLYRGKTLRIRSELHRKLVIT